MPSLKEHVVELKKRHEGRALIIVVVLCLVFGFCIGSKPTIKASNAHKETVEQKPGGLEDWRELTKKQPWGDRANWRRFTNTTLDAASRGSIFSPEQFTPEALETNGLKPVTAVLLSWKRREGLRLVIHYLLKFPYIKEIIIWNNDPVQELDHYDFDLQREASPYTTVRIINSGENVHDLGKHSSCSQATYEHCYFQDDDWLNIHMDSLYTQFLETPNVIISNTMPIIHLEQLRWRFYESEINMHAGFTWLGCGSFLPRDFSQQFLAQLASSSMSRDKLRLADMFFSIWTNQYPIQLVNPLTALDQKDAWSTGEGVDQWAVVYGNIYEAAKELYRNLSPHPDEIHHDYFERQEASPGLEHRTARAPCHNDRCLFLTSLTPFPQPPNIPHFNPSTHASVKELEPEFNALDYPTDEFWNQYQYQFAVDGMTDSCWRSRQDPRPGDYFGLHFVDATEIHHLTIGSSQPISDWVSKLAISVSNASPAQEDSWTLCTKALSTQTQDPCLLSFDLDCSGSELNRILNANDTPIWGYIKVAIATDTWQGPLEVCSIKSDPSQQREKLCAQLSKSLGAVEADRAVQDAGRILSLLTMDGSRANIENGRNWMFSALQTPADLKAFLDYMLAVCNALPLFDGKLHMLYLLSDCLYHASHPQTQWIKRAAYPQLLYLVNSTYRSPQGSETDKQRVLKVLDVWDQHGHYSPDQMRHLREIITIEPPVETTPSRSAASTAGYPPRPFTEADNPREKFQRPVESQAGKKYYQLPVGSMLKVASAQRLPYRPLPSHQITSFTAQLNDALAVVLKEFYDGLETYLDQSSTQTFTEADDHLSHASNGRVRRIDSFGWQEGFLDRVYEQLDRKFKLSGSNGSRDRSYTYGDGDRQRSPPSKREKYSSVSAIQEKAK
ncbi:hypothetical protein BZG36_04762 [Bifiguratus adelaidae]|uniref:CID domain-containing protein n=1 Tax=Bifiguratus adelaidae TaxID=1938954 RepID=A0A261XVK6_9FUNG|nr:hypothetical protein BZG36_04762 [Bifiguratus adelaidae]